MPIQHLRWNTKLTDRLTTLHALETTPPSHGIIVGPGWVDILPPGEVNRQIRRGRIAHLTGRVYHAITPNPTPLQATLAELAATAPKLFATADQILCTKPGLSNAP